MLESANQICRIQCKHQSGISIDTCLASCIHDSARSYLPHTNDGCNACLNFGLIRLSLGMSIVFKDVCTITVTVDFISKGWQSEDGLKPLQWDEL